MWFKIAAKMIAAEMIAAEMILRVVLRILLKADTLNEISFN